MKTTTSKHLLKITTTAVMIATTITMKELFSWKRYSADKLEMDSTPTKSHAAMAKTPMT